MWPLSTSTLPKHFLPFVDGKSLFQANWNSLRKKYSPEEIYLQTNASQAKIAHSQVGELLSENIFIEPETRNQGPATGLAAAFLKKIGRGDEPFMLVQVDDLRFPEEDFLDFIDVAETLSLTTSKYITAGYVPNSVVLGVDYLLRGELVSGDSPIQVFEIADYIDRSETEKINEYMDSGRLLVHTNHTTMTPDNLLAMYKKYKPDWYTPLLEIVNGAIVADEYAKMAKGALEEVAKQSHKAGDSLVIMHPFKWIDFGTWEFVDRFYRENNYFANNGGQVQIDGENNFLWSESGKIMATIGVSDLVVVESKDGILVTKKDSSGKVGHVVDKINSGDV
ncbi:MAG: Mannose-1-phosphate guanylyltransferase [Candidatus Collierbacteria bacterium GW2011_GWB1_44_197]|nr:MAG: Mannose-1-phosphate guanylyltransferase [Candidatus Collierbacteria bacterium GW2011_GWB1_44_197]KKT63707.1 MAG: Mannose-1-phosphate guanylyltransferase [Candidatus Collierbacteria bacterium GW2011_GWC2_44_30]